ncbi:MAG TPA: hypothetical protein VIG08_14145 [Gemmatimonadales bacterium]|jgi:hypothetical protein
MSRNLILASCLALALGTAGCQDQNAVPTAPEHNQPSLSESRLDRTLIALPPGSMLSDRMDAVGPVINPNDYVCDPSSPLQDWFTGEVLRVVNQEQEIFIDLVFNLAADQVPTFDALLFQTEDTPQTFGYDGQFTKKLQKTERDVKRFWNIFSDDIQLIGMHGTMLLDVDRVAAVYEAAFGVPPDEALDLANQVRARMLESQTLNGGNHPLFSFNAFALTTFGGPIPDKILIGDGVLEGYEAVGFGDVAPKAVYAHEFSHHIQFENGYRTEPIPGAVNPDAAERTRYNELMADAFAGYYLTHKHGAHFHRKRVEQFLQVFFQIGDCAFNNANHHGTPNQRMAAARFGFDVADQAEQQGHILTSQEFHELFVAEYPALVAPDAT